ncbi:sigma factor G inhibitor Gin [Terrilactibacillus laevilacticus]|uniref:Sigma factor G inhibitor Gin n=1 Tax=Terrilactibacillus laevilacticus TaxID=1380157 RepID=A0ABW5PRA0_9BACI|nr:sigma factor G inhibitor Gin [Terrilactibacillus laevilacticus]
MGLAAHSCTGEICVICGEIKYKGIHVCNQLICDTCQKDIVRTDVTDEKYRYFISQLSKLKLKETKQ